MRVLHVAGLRFDDNDAAATLSTLVGLEELDLSRTNLTAKGLSHLGHLARLRFLSLNDVLVGDVAVPLLLLNHALETLALERTSITDEGALQLNNLTRLRELSVRGTRISDTGCLDLASMHLVALNISETNVTAACVESLIRTPTLTELYADGISFPVARLKLVNNSSIVSLSLVGAEMDAGSLVVILNLRLLRTLHLGQALSKADQRELEQRGILAD